LPAESPPAPVLGTPGVVVLPPEVVLELPVIEAELALPELPLVDGLVTPELPVVLPYDWANANPAPPRTSAAVTATLPAIFPMRCDVI